jgi:hypothetical protein
MKVGYEDTDKERAALAEDALQLRRHLYIVQSAERNGGSAAFKEQLGEEEQSNLLADSESLY